MFPNKFRNILVAEIMFSACFQMFSARETLFSRLGMLKQCFKTAQKVQTQTITSCEPTFLRKIFAYGGKHELVLLGNNVSLLFLSN